MPGRALSMALRARLPSSVKVFEVGPRDGLQSERGIISTAVKAEFIARLGATGLRYIEATSFVRKDLIPQLGDAPELLAALRPVPGVTYSALVPNAKGMEGAVAAAPPLGEVAVFAAASDAFSMRNINCNVMTSLERFRPVMAAAKSAGLRVRGYVSCVFGCPYGGPVSPDAVAFVARSLLDLGCYEVSLGDTIGVGTPAGVAAVCAALREHGVPVEEAVALHAHATYGMAAVNVLAALQEGVAVFDGSVGGLGGCPYARGASGNLATEDLVYLLHGMGIETGVDLGALAEVGAWICGQLQRENRSYVGVARAAHSRALREAEEKLAAGGLDDAARGKLEATAAACRIGLSWPPPPPGPTAGGAWPGVGQSATPSGLEQQLAAAGGGGTSLRAAPAVGHAAGAATGCVTAAVPPPPAAQEMR